MSKNETLVLVLCQPYCHYFKPGRNEDLLCRGAVVIQRLMDARGPLSPGKASQQDAGRDVREAVTQRLCGACEFRERDCDFAQDRTARPCGGFVLICELLQTGVITVEDLI